MHPGTAAERGLSDVYWNKQVRIEQLSKHYSDMCEKDRVDSFTLDSHMLERHVGM